MTFRDVSRSPVLVVGLLLGISAAVVGVSFRIGPLRLWHLLMLVAFLYSIATSRGRLLCRFRLNSADLTFVLYVYGRVVLEEIAVAQIEHSYRFDAVLQSVFVMLAYFAARVVVHERQEVFGFLMAFAIPGAIAAVFGLVQAVGPAEITKLTVDLTDSDAISSRLAGGEFVRASGLVGHWTGYGAYLLVVSSCFLLCSIERSLGRGRRTLCGFMLLACGFGCAATLTFSIVLGYLVIIVTGSALAGYATRGVVSAVILTLTIGTGGWDYIRPRLFQQYSLGQTKSFTQASGLLPETLVYRWEIWTGQTIPAIMEHPLVGWGQGVYIELGTWLRGPKTIVWPSAESQWLLTLMTGGLLELLLMIILLMQAFKALGKHCGSAGTILRVLIVVALGVAFTVPIFTNLGFPAAFWAVAGAVMSIELPSVDHRRRHRTHEVGNGRSVAV